MPSDPHVVNEAEKGGQRRRHRRRPCPRHCTDAHRGDAWQPGDPRDERGWSGCDAGTGGFHDEWDPAGDDDDALDVSGERDVAQQGKGEGRSRRGGPPSARSLIRRHFAAAATSGNRPFALSPKYRHSRRKTSVRACSDPTRAIHPRNSRHRNRENKST